MKEQLKKILFLIILFGGMLFSPCNVYAKESVNLKVDKTDLEIGDEITVTATMSGNSELYALTAKLVYDNDVFTEIDDSDFDVDDETLNIVYNSKNHKFGMINTSGEISKKLFTVHLKVKKNAKVGDTNIALTDIKTSDGENEIKLKKKSAKVLVTRKATEDEVIQPERPNKVEDTEEVVIKTFTTKPVISVVVIALLLIIAYVIYKKRNEEKVSLFYPIFILVLAAIIISLLTVDFSKKDVNKDGYSDYQDAEDILEYLIDMQGTKNKEKLSDLEESNWYYFLTDSGHRKRFYHDYNNDGRVSVKDAGKAAQNQTKNIHYVVRLTDRKDTDVYIERGKTVINFNATVTPYQNIKQVQVDGKWYPVVKNGAYYTVEVDTPDKAGVHNFNFSKVKLSNNREIDTRLTITKEILKEKPSIYMVHTDHENNKFKFTLKDDDKTIKSGSFTITNPNGDILLSGDLPANDSYDFKYEEDVQYTFTVTATYDLDSDELNDSTGQKNYYENAEIYTHQFVVSSDYDFKIENFTITDAIQKGEKLVVTFDSTNNKGYKVDYIVVNGEKYNVTSADGNHYIVELDGYDTSVFGKYSINIDEVGLDNYEEFYRGEDYEANSLTYNVLRTAPTVDNIHITNNDSAKSVTVTYQFHDEENTYKKLKAVLIDSTGKILSEQVITPSEPVTLSYNGSVDGKYTVNFLADYNLGTDKHDYENKNIGSGEILVNQDIYIERAELLEQFPVKGEPKYTITYYLHNPSANYVTSKTGFAQFATVTINGVDYESIGINGTVSTKISFKVPDEAGLLTLKANRIKLRNENYQGFTQKYFSVPTYESQIDVLRDKPTIDNLEITEENYDEGKATFEFDVIEDKGGFETGEIELNGNIQTIHSGKNTVTFEDIQQDQLFDLKFRGTYDLDTDTLDVDKDQNVYTNQEIYSVPYGLFNDDTYKDITLTNVTSLSNQNNKYYEKLEDVKLKFALEGLSADLKVDISKIVVKGEEYTVEKREDGYYVTLPSYNKSGIKTINITDVILTNGKKVTLEEPAKTEIEVLKDPATIEGFKYEVEDDSINMEMQLKDLDDSISLLGKAEDKVRVKIYDEDNKELYDLPYKDEISFERKDNVYNYLVRVYGSYDRDTTKEEENYYPDTLLLDENISVEKNYIELKDITDINLFTEQNGKTESLEEVQISDLDSHKENYFVEITMKSMPTTYGRIKEVVKEDNRLILVLDYDYTTQENDEARSLRIDFGTIQGDSVTNECHPETFEEFLNRLSANPNETITLKNDLDASSYTSNDSTYITDVFTGTLDGNGYTISNLTKPLFNTINNGTVKNLKIEKVTLDSNAHGTIANTGTSAHLKYVFVNNHTHNGNGGNGTLIGNATGGTIENCKATNFTQGGGNYTNQRVGGLVGGATGLTIKNSAAIGSIPGGWNFRGGLIGQASNCTVENNYTNVNFGYGYGDDSHLVSGILTGSNNVIKNNIVFGKNATNKVSNDKSHMENNYYLVNDGEDDPAEDTDGNHKFTEKDINADLFEKVDFDKAIWNLKNISLNSLPVFKLEVKSDLADEEGYQEEKNTLYNNLSLLMPFYSKEKIIESAELIPTYSPLYKKDILHLVPVDETGNVVTWLTSDNPKKVKKIKIVFKDQSRAVYDVRYMDTYDMVAAYRISDLKIDYTYNHYVIDSDSQLVNNITNYVSGFTYQDNLEPLTPAEDSRILREYYNDVTSKEIHEFVLKFLSNSNYTNALTDGVIDDYLEKEIKKDQKLEKLLYTYSYFKRFYSVDVDGMMLNDFIIFNFQGFNKQMTPSKIADEFLLNNATASDANINISATNTAYNRVLGNNIGLVNIPVFLDYMVKGFSDLDTADWYAGQFKGYLLELGIEGREDIQYRLWDHIRQRDTATGATWYNYALPIITLPKDAGYIISIPGQFVIGAQRVYMADPTNPTERAAFQEKVDVYIKKMQDYYTTTAKIVEKAKYFNDIHTIQIDRRVVKDENGTETTPNPYSTQEPFSKNFNEVVGQFIFADGNAATANGAYILWRAYACLDSDWTFGTWSHETAHNMDARLFLKQNGRRFNGFGEDYSDNIFAQRHYNDSIHMNLSKHYPKQEDNTKDIGSNLEPSRIDSPQKVWDFYKKVFETIYIMDYLEGKAFLKLKPEEQTKLVVQASYPNEKLYEIDDDGNNEEYKQLYYENYGTTVYQTIEEEKVRDMNLDSIDDLYDNQLVMFPSVIYSTYGYSKYGGEGIYKVRWYQPHNDYGRPDSYSMKWLAYEMLGYAGYDDGFIQYFSNIDSIKKNFYSIDKDGKRHESTVDYKTDLMALRAITKDPTMTYETYKKNRFKEVEEHLADIQVINVNDMFTKFYEALKKDAQAVKEAEEKAYQQYPDSSDPKVQAANVTARNNMISSARQYPASTAVRREIYYTMKNTTDDFTTEVYNSNNKQDIKPFTVPEDLEKVSTMVDDALSKIKDITENDSNAIVEEDKDDKETDNEKAEEDKDKPEVNTPEQPTPENPTPPEKVPPLVPDTSKDVVTNKKENEGTDGKQQDDPKTSTGPIPDPNPDSVQTPAVVLPVS